MSTAASEQALFAFESTWRRVTPGCPMPNPERSGLPRTDLLSDFPRHLAARRRKGRTVDLSMTSPARLIGWLTEDGRPTENSSTLSWISAPC